jgi:hypothetical protein
MTSDSLEMLKKSVFLKRITTQLAYANAAVNKRPLTSLIFRKASGFEAIRIPKEIPTNDQRYNKREFKPIGGPCSPGIESKINSIETPIRSNRSPYGHRPTK